MKKGGVLYHIKSFLKKAWLIGETSEDFVKKLRNRGIRIGKNVNFRFPYHTTIDMTRPCLIEFGDNIDINDNFTVMTHDFGTFVFLEKYDDFVNCSGKVSIGSNIVIGRDVTILKGVTIGDNCIIGLGSVVSKSIPSNSVAVGSPARVICSIDEYYQKRKTLQVKEALEYGRELANHKGGLNMLSINDFTEEWTLFLSEEEYNLNEGIRREVDSRIKGKVDIAKYLNRPRPYSNYDEFIKAIR